MSTKNTLDAPLLKVLKLDNVREIIYKASLIFNTTVYVLYFWIWGEKINQQLAIKIKLRKRFVAGACLGYTISDFILQNGNRARLISNYRNGVIYGYWGVAIISLDHLQDSVIDDTQCINKLTEECISILKTGNISTDYEFLGLDKIDRDTILSVQSIFLRLHTHIKKKKNSTQLFIEQAEALLKGQLYSIEQKKYSLKKDFAWYFNDVLNQKTLNFYLAPISLFCKTSKCFTNLEILKGSFLKLNKCYFHWQLIDDVTDLTKDTRDGLITAPGYIILSQGKLAKKISFPNSITNSSETLLDFNIENNILLKEQFSNSYIFDNLQANSPITQIQIALCNSTFDLSKDIYKLIEEKISLSDGFIESHKENNHSKMLTYLSQSETCNRILLSTMNKTDIDQFKATIVKENITLTITMKTLNFIIHKCYNRAIRNHSI